MIYMWQEERGKPFYRFQTSNKTAADKMKRRKKFNLVSQGINYNLWIYLAEFSRPDIAKKALKTLTGNTVKYCDTDDLFYSSIKLSSLKKDAA